MIEEAPVSIIKAFFYFFSYLRVQHYSYKYTKIGSKDAIAGRWWKRRLIGQYMPPISLESIKDIMKNMQIDMPRVKKGRKKKN